MTAYHALSHDEPESHLKRSRFLKALDRLFRNEAAVDRSLNQSLDRLERLQKRRSGERIPPSASLRLTQ
jgi:hypothetical protein